MRVLDRTDGQHRYISRIAAVSCDPDLLPLARRGRGVPSIRAHRSRNRLMGHTVRDKNKLIRRVQRIVGQVEAVERALAGEHDCGRRPTKSESRAANELIAVVRRYVR